jgi:hypothetical protein
MAKAKTNVVIAKSGEPLPVEHGAVEPLVATTAKLLSAWLDTIAKKGALSHEEKQSKEVIIGEKHSLVDAIVALGNLSIKFDENRNRKQIAEVLEEGEAELSSDDREILRRYLDSLQRSGV